MSIYLSDGNRRLKKLAGRLNTIDNALDPASKNPVQNKVLYKPVTFAESERLKSTNLLKVNESFSKTQAGVTINYDSASGLWTINGTCTGDNQLVTLAGYFNLPLEENNTYYLMKEYVSGSIKTSTPCDFRFYPDSDYYDEPYLTLKIREDFSFRVISITSTLHNMYFYMQNAGIVFNNYQFRLAVYKKDDGKIIHSTNNSVLFAESERQKSKNLFYLNVDKRGNSAGVEYIFDKTNQAFLIHGTSTGYGSINTLHMEPVINYLKAGKTYTLSTHYARGSMSLSGYSVLYLATSDGNKTITFDGVPRSITYTPTVDTYISGILLDMAQGNTYNDVVCQIQVEEGEVATEWQYPYGAIVHKEDIADVEHYEKFYSVLDGKTTINNEDFGSGLPISTNIISDTFSKYKALIIKSKRNEQLLVSRLEVVEDYLNYSSGIMLNNNGGYLIIHNFSYNKNYKSFNFIGGGYCYIDGVSETKFNSESSESNNLIYEIVGVLK